MQICVAIVGKYDMEHQFKEIRENWVRIYGNLAKLYPHYS